MNALVVFLVGLAGVALIGLTLSVKVVTQYQKGVLFRLGKVVGVKEPGLALIIPVIDRLVRVSLRIVTMPIQSQGIITRDNVSVDISAVAYFRVVDPLKSVIAIEKRRRHDQPDRADDAAQGGRSTHPGRGALRNRRHQRQHPEDPRCGDPRAGRRSATSSS